MIVTSIFKDKNITIMEDFNSTHISWVGDSVGDTETVFAKQTFLFWKNLLGTKRKILSLDFEQKVSDT